MCLSDQKLLGLANLWSKNLSMTQQNFKK